MSLWDCKDLLVMVVSLSDDWQLNHWIMQIQKDRFALRMLAQCARVFEFDTFMHLAKVFNSSDHAFVLQQSVKTNYLDRWDDVLEKAPLWFIDETRHLKPRIAKIFLWLFCLEAISFKRLQYLLNLANFESWDKDEQAEVFASVCSRQSLKFVRCVWNHAALQNEEVAFTSSSGYSRDNLAFILANCKFKFYGFLRAGLIAGVQTPWGMIENCPNLKTAISLWPQIKIADNFLNNIDETIVQFWENCRHSRIWENYRHSRNNDDAHDKPTQTHFICFTNDMFYVDDNSLKLQFQNEKVRHPKIPFLQQLICAAQTNMETKNELFEDTLCWMTKCAQSPNAEYYFFYAIEEDIAALLVFLWNTISEQTRTEWRSLLPQCLRKSRLRETLEFAAQQLPNYVEEHKMSLLKIALKEKNVVLWEFVLASLNAEDLDHVCEMCMRRPTIFFEKAWKYVHVHVNKTERFFTLALMTQTKGVAGFLAKQPSFDPSQFSENLPALIALSLSSVIKRIRMPRLTLGQKKWCATRAFHAQNNRLLNTLFERLALCKQIWRTIALQHEIENMTSSFIQLLMRLEILNDVDLFNINNKRFQLKLNIVYYQQ